MQNFLVAVRGYQKGCSSEDVEFAGISQYHATVPASTEPDRGGGHHDALTVWVEANLVDVAINVYGGLPRYTAVGRPRDTADVDVGEEVLRRFTETHGR